MSNVAVYSFPWDYRKDLPRAYEGEVPMPFYRLSVGGLSRRSRRHRSRDDSDAGIVVCPYLPPDLSSRRVISFERLEESLERIARREESD
jgi:hypothetical protein